MISFEPFNKTHLATYYEWCEKDHVKNTWFLDGYEPKEYVLKKIKGNGYDYPFIILLDEVPLGYITYSDLFAYRSIVTNPKGVFTKEEEGTYCFDLFIGDENFLNKGYGTKIVKAFSSYLFDHVQAKKILIDPSKKNLRAVRCYEKAGFKSVKEEYDGTEWVLVMEMTKLTFLQSQ